MGPATGLLALAVLKKDLQPSAHDRSSIINRRPQLLKPQFNYEPTQEPCGALNLSMKTAPTERFATSHIVDPEVELLLLVIIL